jgi:hypothetical protein
MPNDAGSWEIFLFVAIMMCESRRAAADWIKCPSPPLDAWGVGREQPHPLSAAVEREKMRSLVVRGVWALRLVSGKKNVAGENWTQPLIARNLIL